jgi:hypothetical protein
MYRVSLFAGARSNLALKLQLNYNLTGFDCENLHDLCPLENMLRYLRCYCENLHDLCPLENMLRYLRWYFTHVFVCLLTQNSRVNILKYVLMDVYSLVSGVDGFWLFFLLYRHILLIILHFFSESKLLELGVWNFWTACINDMHK